MDTPKPPSYDELKARLETAESELKAMREGLVDATAGKGETLVTHPTEAEARQSHLKQVLLAIRNVNQLIVAENDPQRLIELACVNLTETMGYHNAWIVLLGGQAARELGLPESGPVAAAAAAGFGGAFDILRERFERGEFPDCMKRTLASEVALVTGAPAADCPDCPLSGHYGGRAGLARRLEFDGVTWGILTASVPAAYARDAEEQDLFNEVAGDIAFALHKIAVARKLEQSRRYMAFVIEGSGVGTWEWNIQTNETRLNEQWAAMLGYTIEELAPYDYTTWERLVHPEDIDHARQALTDCIEGRTDDYSSEFRMLHKDGHWVWLLSCGRVMTRDEAGRALSMYGTHTDITEQKHLLYQSIEAHSFLETVLDQSPFPMWIGDAEGTLIRTNQALREALNLTDAQLVGRYNPLHDPNVIREGLTETVRAVIEQHTPVRFTMLWRPEEFGGEGYERGRDRHVDLAMYPIVRDGKLQNIVTQWQDITERVQADERMRENELRLRLAMESASEGVWEWDIVTGLVTFDEVCLRMVGYEADFPPQPGEWWIGQIHIEDRPAVDKAYTAFLDGQTETYAVEFRLATRGGEYAWVASTARIVRSDERGKPLLIVGIHRDITQEKQAEAAQRESDEKFRTFVENANDIIYQVNPDGVFTYASPNWAEILGYRLDEVIGETVDKFVHPDDVHLCIEFLNKVLSSGEKQSGVEYRVKHKNGTWRWHSSNGAPVKDANGKIISYIGIARDINEIKEQEKARSDLHQRYETVVKNFPNGAVFLFDKNMKYIHVEGKALKEVGLVPDEMIGKTVKETFPPEVSDVAYKNQQLLFEGKTCYYEVEFAGHIYANWGEPVINNENQIEEGLVFAVDITDRKQVEEALRESERRVRAKLNALLDPEGDIGTLHLSDIVDCDEIQSLMHDFHALTDIGVGIIDLDGAVLVGAGWQDVCMNFHRVHPETEKLCRESDTALASGVEPGTFKIYKCKNNLWDMVTPIMVGGKHVGNLFLGQFFFEDEAPDIATFREQARRYKFDEEAYLKAYQAIPRWSPEMVDRVMTFYCNLINVISRLSYAHIKLARTTEALRRSEGKFRALVDNTIDWIWETDANGTYTYVSENVYKMLGYASEELLGRTPFDFMDNEEAVRVRGIFQEIAQKHDRIVALEDTLLHKDGNPVIFETNATPVIAEDGDLIGYFGTCRDITVRRKAEETLKEALLRQREAVRAGNIGLWDWDLRTNTVQYSEEWKRQIGYKGDEIGDDFDEWESRVHPDDLPQTLEQVKQNIRDRTSGYQVEFRFRHKDGSYRWILARATVLTDEQGEPVRTLGSHIDITERKRTEEALRESEQRLQAVFSAVDGVPIQGYDKDRRVIFWNPASEKLYGYAHDEAMGRFLEELIIPEEAWEAVVEGIRQWYDQGIPIPTEEIELLNKNGQRLQVYSNHVMITNHRGEKEMFCIDVDLTERRRAEQELRGEREQLLSIFNSVDTVIYIADPTTHEMLYANRFLQEQLPADYHGKKCYKLLQNLDAPCPFCTNDIILRHKPETHHWEFHNENLARHYAIADRIIRWPDGRDVRLEIAIDITEIKQAEEDRERLSAQLQQAQKMESVGRLAGGVAHDFNNMLNVILGHVEIMLDDLPTDSPQREDLDEIRKAADRSANLTRQLLAFARKQTVAPKDLDLNETVASTLKMLQRLIGEDIELLS